MKLPKGPKITIPKGPKLSVPKLGKKKDAGVEASASGAKRSARSAPKIKAPGFVNDIYRDLRDRRLIVPALALLAAIVIVPVALSSKSEPVPAATPAPLPDDVSAVQPAVVRETLVGVRDYRDRLDDLKSTNPFKQQFRIPVESESDVEELATPVAPAPVPGGTVTPPPPADDGGDSSQDSVEVPAPAPVPPTEPEILILSSRVDVSIGRIGEQKDMADIKQGQVLPDRDAPVVMFLGANDDLSAASFLVSTDVTGSAGDGGCAPSAQDCQFLELKDGESRTFDYGPEGVKYRLKVTDILEKVVDKRQIEQD